jgi:SAM-dependent methyltransferase
MPAVPAAQPEGEQHSAGQGDDPTAACLPLAGPQALKDNVAAGFAAAAEAYDVGGTEFFRPVGQWLVESAQVPAGAWVLDAGCGRGTVTIPAALAAGPKGHVTGIDLAAPMLACAREHARCVGLTNVTFREGDAEDPGTYPGWAPDSFDVILAGNVIQLFPRPARAARRWLDLLMPGGILGVAWTPAQDPQWVPVIAAIDAYVPDGVPAFGVFMRRPPFDNCGAFERMLTEAGYLQVTTVTREIALTYAGPEQWRAIYQAHGPWALSWRHIPAERIEQARRDAFAALEPLRAADGSVTRTLTFAFTTGQKAT